jgi:uncharacterized SAM-binding protein YcdF (DUF218 family)
MNELKELTQRLWNWLDINQTPEKSDIIFLFGGAILNTPQKGFELFNENLAPYIVATGLGGTFGNPEWTKPIAEMFANYLIKKGVPQEKIVIQNTSTNTPEDVKIAIPLLEQMNIPHDSAIIVSRPVHQRRAFATFAKLYPEIKLLNSPCFETEPNQIKDQDELMYVATRCIQEYERLITYGKKGDLVIQQIPAEVADVYDQLKHLNLE